ncbi:hypothetical protein [Microbulbifer sp. VAAF005]|uniref:hypothetical protein n=1 Tax=Microbulbifer sp. VAAF005 TaxID=3034230 RepID=UPI0024ADF25B|nr:hypothetical protein [Microbulbifer sp. VAAF005]WHI45607.1 hypothetical protein P0078_18015 [Microbulbifer sp. VAAF005]
MILFDKVPAQQSSYKRYSIKSSWGDLSVGSFNKALYLSSIFVLSACGGGGGGGDSSGSQSQSQSQSNNQSPPVATAPTAVISGPARVVDGELVTLSAAESTSNNDSNLTYQWRRLTSGEEASKEMILIR